MDFLRADDDDDDDACPATIDAYDAGLDVIPNTTPPKPPDLPLQNASSPTHPLPPPNPALPSSPSTFCVHTLNNLFFSSRRFNNPCVLVGVDDLEARRREAMKRRYSEVD